MVNHRSKEQFEGLSLLISKYLSSNTTMVEIGSYSGDSSFLFFGAVKFITCIDPWENNYDPQDVLSYSVPMDKVEKLFDKKFWGRNNFRKLKMKSQDAVSLFENESLDFVYIDALHTYEGVKKDIELWFPKIKNNGLIGGHDYTNGWLGVIQAVNEAFKKPDETFPDSSWIVRKK